MTTEALRDSKSNPVEVSPRMPDPALPEADWADAFDLKSETIHENARSLAEKAFGSMPGWVQPLLVLRNILVAPFGLKRDGSSDAPLATDRIGFFPILQASDERVVLGFDDNHLDFRILVEREADQSPAHYRVTTLVKRHNLFGRLYIAIITPFHKAIVKAALRQAA